VACVGGKAVALSQDHHPQDKKELMRIKKAGGYVRGGRVNEQLNLSRSIGDI
jgi:serine/threonine protein phosphatase PrpC